MNEAQAGAGVAGSAESSALPPLHNTWLGTITGIHNPASEPKSTCGDCVMCAGVERSASRVTFSPDVKCCSYIPHLANFLVGRSLLGPGHDSVAARIKRRAGVTPLGLGLSHADILRVVGEQSQFGRSPVVVCPHFDQNTKDCGIWQTRNAVCSTWFCKHERGAASQRFWHAVRDLLMAAEERVAHHCLTQGGLADEQVNAVVDHRAGIRAIIARANAGEAVPETAIESTDWYEPMWGDWAGREEDWFRATADTVTAMGPDKLISLLADVPHLSQAVADRWHDLSVRNLPDRLTFRPRVGSEATADVLRLVGYSPFDPLLLPAALLADLRHLDGRKLTAVREESGSPETLLDDNLLQLLDDFDVTFST